jgi:hypothetical protein
VTHSVTLSVAAHAVTIFEPQGAVSIVPTQTRQKSGPSDAPSTIKCNTIESLMSRVDARGGLAWHRHHYAALFVEGGVYQQVDG